MRKGTAVTVEKENANSLDSVAVIAQLLDELAAAPAPVGVSEIARALNQSKARIHRNLVSLKHFGLIDQDEATDKYRLGWKLFQLGERAGVQSNIRAMAAPYLKLLCETTGQSSLLSIPLNGEALVIAAVDNDSNVSITVKPGNRPLPHCSAQGRIALAYATDTQRERLLSGPLAAHTPHSLLDIQAIRLRLQRIREQLMEDAPNEALTGINVFAAPILRSAKDLIGIVAIVGSIQNIPPSPGGTMADIVRGCAAALSKQFGCDAYAERGIAIPPEIRRLMPGGK
ncbi:IclR family transcriptional regulator [Polaromonas sp.]|uniref:IclR family transcriptional regulator n=1 Tax=Polaromonas sp. TaxID=1869339 RepID=UPI0017B34B4D|nr:IclR family transcriptional regulator [Polaromonas sp.]NMM05936.1 IclR family transcriptional regulator [Polaromonas sp.]